MWSKQLSVVLLVLACLLAVEGRGQADDRQERIWARFDTYRQGPLRVVVVEARPKGAHPVYSHRVLYIDLQTWVTLYAFAYDHAGHHQRTFLLVYLHPQFNPGKKGEWIPQIATQASIDYQRERASIFQTQKVLYNQLLNPHRFSLMGLMLQGK